MNLQKELRQQGHQVGRTKVSEILKELGSRYEKSYRLLITADSGGSNDHRNRLWKPELQRLLNETGMKIEACHYPPGTSKLNFPEKL